MRALMVPLVAAVITVAVMLYQARTGAPTLCEAPEVRLDEIEGFVAVPIEPSEAELHSLPSDTIIIKRRYSTVDGQWFQVSVLIGGHSKGSIHRPEMCLPSQGFQMMNPRDVDVAGVDWHMVTLARRDAPPQGFAYTFFNQTGFRTSSHMHRIFVDVWDRSILGRIDRWVMVTVNSSVSDDMAIRAFLRHMKEMVMR